MGRLMTEAEVEAEHGFKPRTLRQWRYTGDGPPFVKLNGRMVRYLAEDIEKWIASQRHDPAA